MVKQLIISLLFLLPFSVKGQEWVSNEMTEYFFDKAIYDMSVNEGVMWVSSDGVIRADSTGFKVYDFDSISSDGKLQNFETKFPAKNNFYELVSNGETTYLFNRHNFTNNFIKIENDYVEYIHFPINEHIFEFLVDDEGKLWVHTSEMTIKYNEDLSSIEELYYLEGGGFKKYEFERDNKNPRSFIVDGNRIYAYMSNPLQRYEFEMWVIENRQVIYKYVLTPKNKLGHYRFDKDENNIYLKSAGEDFYVIKRNEPEIIIEKYETPFETRDFWYYKVFNDWIFYSDDKGLQKYNYKTDTLIKIPLSYNPHYRFFTNFNLYKDSLLIGQNAAGYGSYSLIPEISSSIRILNIK